MEEAKYKHRLLRANYKWMQVRTKENFLDSFPNLCLMGLLNWLVPSQPDTVTSIYEELMYTRRVAKVSRLVTPEFHIHYMYNWNWI